MPAINEQRPPRQALKAQPQSILAEAIDIKDLATDYIKLAIYGRNRTGKTFLATEFPKPLLLVSFEPGQSGGAKTAKAKEGVKFIHIVNKGKEDHRGVKQKEWATAKANALALELQKGCPFKTVVLDTVTSYQDLILQEILDLPEIVEQLNYGMVTEDQYRMRSERCREHLRPWLDIPAHTIFLAQEKDHNQQKGDRTSKILRGLHQEAFFSVDLGGATAKWLQDGCDYICQLFLDKEVKQRKKKDIVVNGEKRPGGFETYETGKMVRRLRTMYHVNFMAGCRSEVPLNIPEFIEEPTYEKIDRLVRGVKQQIEA